MKKIILVLLLLVTCLDAGACSFARGFEEFIPKPSRKPNDRTPNAPVAKIVEIKRGFDDGNGGSCSDAGVISIQFEKINPVDSTGYKFKITSGIFNSHVFPSGSVMPSHFGQDNTMFFVWLDGSKNYQEPIDFTLEIIAVFANENESQPYYLDVVHAGGKSN